MRTSPKQALAPKRPSALVLALILGVVAAVLGSCASAPSNSSGAADSDQSNTDQQSQAEPDPRGYNSNDPKTWSNKKLAAQLVLAGVQSANLSSTKSWSKAGVGGLVIFGTPPSDIRTKIAQTRAQSPGKRLIVASDEEGGAVQRLARLVGKYPSAAQIGRTKTVAQTEALARGLGKKLKALGVNSDLAPVADMLYKGSWTAKDGRAFKSSPSQNAKYVAAFAKGLQSAGVSATVKHWPGGGAAADTHVGAGKLPSWDKLQKRDLIPFEVAFKTGTASVMVSHARIPGLTGKIPATQSTKAYRALRKQAGNKVVIMTDSLGMAAVTRELRQSPAQAAVRALSRGADLALIQDVNPKTVIKKITEAIKSGRINRAAAIASAQRILDWQLRFR